MYKVSRPKSGLEMMKQLWKNARIGARAESGGEGDRNKKPESVTWACIIVITEIILLLLSYQPVSPFFFKQLHLHLFL